MPNPTNVCREFDSFRAWLIAWLLLLAFIYGFGSYKASLNRRDQVTRKEWWAHIEKLKEQSQIVWKDRVARVRSLRGQADSKAQLEREFNDGQPFALKSDGKRQIFEWTDPEYGGRMQLSFDDGVLVGHNAKWGTGDVEQLHGLPPPLGRSGVLESLRKALVWPSFVVWLVAFLGSLAFRKLRVALGQLMLASALIYGTAWLASPKGSISWQFAASNECLYIALVMILLSVAVLAHMLAVEADPIRPQFSLRWLFYVMTAAALLFAAGPFGYVTLYVVVASLIVGWAVYYYYRFVWLDPAQFNCAPLPTPDTITQTQPHSHSSGSTRTLRDD